VVEIPDVFLPAEEYLSICLTLSQILLVIWAIVTLMLTELIEVS
jgi:hypothetical protein